MLGPVPIALTSFFRAGGLRITQRLFEEIPTPLQFINQMRRLYPKDPQVSNEEYMGWLGYLYSASRQYSLSAALLNQQGLTEGIDLSGIARNFFVATSGGEQGRYLIKYRYISVNPVTGSRYEQEAWHWVDDLSTTGSLFTRLNEKTQEILDRVVTSAQAQRRYNIQPGSLELTAVVRRF